MKLCEPSKNSFNTPAAAARRTEGPVPSLPYRIRLTILERLAANMLLFQDPVYCVMADTRSPFELANSDVENLLPDCLVRHNLFRAPVYPLRVRHPQGTTPTASETFGRCWGKGFNCVSDLEVKCDL